MSSESKALSTTSRDQPAINLTGKVVANDFRILRRLGAGGMGQVYLAEQLSLERKVALKLLLSDLASEQKALDRFEVEAKAVAKATHANIVQVYAYGEWQGMHYVALEYVEGRNLREHLEKKGPPELLLALSIMRQVASALQRASELGITHRDIKPENILLTRKREVKVTDFGLARDPKQQLNLTQTGVAMGTPLYMSPEQVEGRSVDPRSDIYSFGVTCYHLLAGNPPFQGSTPIEVALKHVREEPPALAKIRPDLPTTLCDIIHRMMEKDPADRFQTARELLVSLERIRSTVKGHTDYVPLQSSKTSLGNVTNKNKPKSETEKARQPSPNEELHHVRFRWQFPLLVATLVLLAFLAGTGAAWFAHRNDREKAAPTPALSRTTHEQRERELHVQVERYLAWAEGYQNVQSGIGQCSELALLYLNEGNQIQALQLFETMTTAGSQLRPQPSDMREYNAMGVLGEAIVLAKVGKHEQSRERFREAFGLGEDKKISLRGRMYQSLLRNVELKMHLRDALELNRAAGYHLQVPSQLIRLAGGPPIAEVRPERRPKARRP